MSFVWYLSKFVQKVIVFIQKIGFETQYKSKKAQIKARRCSSLSLCSCITYVFLIGRRISQHFVEKKNL